MNFYGLHELAFNKGLNIVFGPCLSGKTNLCRAIEFILFGCLHNKIPNIINHQHEEESSRLHRLPSAEAKLQLVIDGKNQTIDRDYMRSDWYDRERHTETLGYFNNLDNILTTERFHSLIRFSESTIFQDENANATQSIAQRLVSSLTEKINQNIENGYGCIILDDTTSRLTLTKEIELIKTASTNLDQIILLTSRTHPQHQDLEELDPRILHLNRNLETLKLETENFPLPGKTLQKRASGWFEGHYLTKGDTFTQEIFDHEYTLKVTEATPEGSRFTEMTEIFIE